jgi:hypothetical protein
LKTTSAKNEKQKLVFGTQMAQKYLVVRDTAAWREWEAVHPRPHAVVGFSDYGEVVLKDRHVFWDGMALQSFPPQYKVIVESRLVSCLMALLFQLCPKGHRFGPHVIFDETR